MLKFEQESYTSALIRERLAFAGPFNARLVSTGELVYVLAINELHHVKIQKQYWKNDAPSNFVNPENLKSL